MNHFDLDDLEQDRIDVNVYISRDTRLVYQSSKVATFIIYVKFYFSQFFLFALISIKFISNELVDFY